MYVIRIEACNSEEAEEFIAELNAPLDPEIAKAEQNVGRWLRGG